ncbi:hypothetical protein RRG08_004907 [Elysia crispata]|uniref:Uncharacterized protein n=1 Tax=Elysia crispata TaxID=231223 RepID=A0AAE0ZI07_9GAST|nr:hypothetical protein RRG08_004907 [Elysia crispata]
MLKEDEETTGTLKVFEVWNFFESVKANICVKAVNPYISRMMNFNFNNRRVLCVSTILVCFLLTFSSARDCSCPSCNQANPMDRCKCCVYRVLGKRARPEISSDPRVNFLRKSQLFFTQLNPTL